MTAAARAGRYDAVVVGAGHNGLTAAAYLARAGRSVLVLEALDHVGGAAVSERVFDGVDARLSRYSYLVSLLPHLVVRELGLPVELRRRRISSYTPARRAGRDLGLLVDSADEDRTAASFDRLTGGPREFAAWREFYSRIATVAGRIFPTMTQPLLDRAQLRAAVADDEVWDLLVEQPLGTALRERFDDDVVRGVVATDALIGTFADLDEDSLRQNRCFLYHLIGNGTGDWDVPVGGMGAVTAALYAAAVRAGATVTTRARVTAIDPDGEVEFVEAGGGVMRVGAGHVLAACAPSTLATLLGEEALGSPPEGAQLKINMVVRRLPRPLGGVAPEEAFAGTFHVNESMTQLQAAYREAAAGRIPSQPPCEVYCHTLTDASILGAGPRREGVHTMTLFGLHLPERLFRADPEGSRAAALQATMASLDSVLAEPIADCLAVDAAGRPCLEVRTPVDLEAELGLPGGHIFHRDLSWPFAENDDVGRWGVETAHPRVLSCGAGARRGGGVSGIPGRAAAMACGNS